MLLFIRVYLKFIRRVLLYVHVEVAGDIQSVPLVIDHDDLSCDGHSLISHFPAKITIDSPFQVERVLCFDYRLVYIIICNPLSVDLNLCSGNLENNSFIIPLIQRNGL